MDKIYLLISWDGYSHKPLAAFSNKAEAEKIKNDLNVIFFTPSLTQVDIQNKVNDILEIDNYWYGPRWGFEVEEVKILK